MGGARRRVSSAWRKSWLKATRPTMSSVRRCVCSATSVARALPPARRMSTICSDLIAHTCALELLLCAPQCMRLTVHINS